MNKITAISALSALSLALSVPAQTHTRSPLVLGQDASFGVESATPGSIMLLGLGATGLGAGSCFPNPISVCLGILEPVVYFPALVVDGSGEASHDLVLPSTLPLVPLATQAMMFDLSGGFSVTTTNAIEGPIVPLSAWSDSFDGTELDASWSIYNSHLLDYSVSGGELHLRPTQSGPPVTWYADGEGPLVYKLVRGDFDVRATVRAYVPGSPGQAPPATFRMGGISLRDPSSVAGNRNWLHVSVGSGDLARPVAVEDKTTQMSNSNLQLTALSSPSAEIRAVRSGNDVTFYYRENAAAAWTALRTFARPDLPPTIQVGLMVYSWDSPNTVQASFEEITFANL